MNAKRVIGVVAFAGGVMGDTVGVADIVGLITSLQKPSDLIVLSILNGILVVVASTVGAFGSYLSLKSRGNESSPL